MQNLEQGGGRVRVQDGGYTLTRPPSTGYANAQIQDYGRVMPHRAPLYVRLRARFSHPGAALRGTAGFGLWNAPLAPAYGRVRLPKAAWFFFGSPPLDLPLALGVPGHGFKTATMDAATPLFLALAPTAPLAALAMRVPALYRRLYPIAQHAIRASEAPLGHDLTETHDYELAWTRAGVAWRVDGRIVHRSVYRPRGRLGFVAWIDNQYAVVTPQGRLGWGLVPCEEPQHLIIESLSLTSSPSEGRSP